MYVIGPVFRADQESLFKEKLGQKKSDINFGKAEDYDSLLRSLQKRLDQDERQRHSMQKRVAELERKF